jgi:alpha-L-rhamnosidase
MTRQLSFYAARIFTIPLFFLCLIIQSCDSPMQSSASGLMKKAIPVWAEGREKEMNLNLGFHGVFRKEVNQNVKLRITASTLYRVFINGKFLGYGPARAAHGFFRIDDYDLSRISENGVNVIAVEVAGYNVNSYYTIDEPSFLQAEVESDGKILLATGSNSGFDAFQIKERLQKAERYSFQRPFTEYYKLNSNWDAWRITPQKPAETLTLIKQQPVKLLPRNLLLPEFDVLHPVELYAHGTIQYKKPEKYYKDRSLTGISTKYKGYKEDEIEVFPSQLIQEISDKSIQTVAEPYTGNAIAVNENEFTTFRFGTDLSGFIGCKLSCEEPSEIILYFDEILTDGDVNTKKRMPDVNNQVVYELQPGTYCMETFESYTFQFLKVIIVKGKCKINDIYLREYAYPENRKASFQSSNDKLNAIYRASRQSFRQNAVDIFMDCPSRERAGWLCDSYFTAIMEKDFTGKSAVAHNFYENFALPDSFKCLPDGMLPMCYPSDHNDGVFIPNWAMWFIIQIDDYAKRGGDPELVTRLEPRISKLLGYFEKFENKDGLLEKLDSWVFVEWSKANDFVQDVNYPTNMLYSAALEKAGHLYRNDKWLNKAEHIRQTILKQSFNGTFFVDNAVRERSGKLKVTSNTTEVCQYYAFFFNIATPETHPDLWKKLTTEFGPKRDASVSYPNVFPANAFVGNYLRMDILSRYGLQKQLLNEIQDYFYGMARQTGTLWENMAAYASCNHGFASYLGHVLYRDVLGIENVDYLNKKFTIRFSDIDLEKCNGVLPVGEDSIGLRWEKQNGRIVYSIHTPAGFHAEVVNKSSLKAVAE